MENNNLLNENTTKRNITLHRQKRFWACAVSFYCVLDEKITAEVKNGKSVSFSIDSKQHEIFVYANLSAGDFYSNTLVIEADSLDKSFELQVKSGWWNGKGELTLISK